MNTSKIALVLGVFSTGLVCAAEKPDFSGVWRPESSQKGVAQAVKIEQKDQDIRISNSLGDDKQTSIACNTMGKECNVRVQGAKAKVTYYYNGPVLVEMWIEGKNNDRVVKKRRTLSEDGKTMTVEVIPIVPAGKDSYKETFVRDQEAETTATASSKRQ